MLKHTLGILAVLLFIAGCAPKEPPLEQQMLSQEVQPVGDEIPPLGVEPGEWFPTRDTDCKSPEFEERCNKFCSKYPGLCPGWRAPPGGERLQPSEMGEPSAQPEASMPWKYGGSAVPGKYADAEVVDLGNGKYRMYYSEEPEASGFKGRVYSALSSDGKSWAQESGTRMEWATFPSVLKLDGGTYRMYYQNGGIIKSAASSDGLSWSEESGTRMNASNNAGLTLENVAAPTVMKSGSEYIMVYRGTIKEKYNSEVPNPDTQLFLWATSSDGLSFEKKGIALDSRNEMFKGLLDGAELVQWDDGIRVYFWTYKGVYHASFGGSKFTADSAPDYSTAENPRMEFAPNPPGDPALAKINGKWFMYYGQHTKGIYYAEYE